MNSRLLRPAFRALRGPPTTASIPFATREFTTSSPKMTVHVMKSLSQFKETISSEHIVAIDAWATWCGPCRFISPVFENMSDAEEFKDKIYFAKVDVDEVQDLAQELGVRAMPTFQFFKGGEKVDELVGASPQALESALAKILE